MILLKLHTGLRSYCYNKNFAKPTENKHCFRYILCVFEKLLCTNVILTVFNYFAVKSFIQCEMFSCRSKLVHRADLNGWPNTTKFFVLKRNWVLQPSLPGRTSANLRKLLQVHRPEYHRDGKPTAGVVNDVIILFAQY